MGAAHRRELGEIGDGVKNLLCAEEGPRNRKYELGVAMCGRTKSGRRQPHSGESS